ncbi:hypothetical protein PR048_002145 [Dryococelus australis]|uniref:Uncharacterized protein n=1 Tax=Dryococelus australis TaxID=614101 RepID=A0ABQ9IKW1_9NEOP|nr:hypothetical protein PR048_002145 [Dryococelus australis]
MVIVVRAAIRYMALVAKLTGGKRMNYTLRGSYHRRCYRAGLAHTYGTNWHLSPWKCMSGKCEEIKKKKRGGVPDQEYGPDAAQPEIDEHAMECKKSENLAKLNSDVETSEQREKLERDTVGQHSNFQ